MKKIIYSIGIFETELAIQSSEVRSGVDTPYIANVSTPKYKLRKTSYCMSKFILDDGDEHLLKSLTNKAHRAYEDFINGLISQYECDRIYDVFMNFAYLYDKALRKESQICESVRYIELADESSRGCTALYQLNDGKINQEIACKVGDILESKLDTTYFQFLPIKAVTNYDEPNEDTQTRQYMVTADQRRAQHDSQTVRGN